MEDLLRTTACEADQSTEVERVIALVMKAIEGDVRRIAEALVLKRDDQLLGPGEFELREKVLGMACHMLEATVNNRNKGGTKITAWPAPIAAKTPGSSSGAARLGEFVRRYANRVRVGRTRELLPYCRYAGCDSP